MHLDEPIKENTEAFKFCLENNFKPFISSINLERLNRIREKIKQAQSDFFKNKQCLDIGYKVFLLTPKPKIAENKNGLFAVENERSNAENTLFNMLCATCKSLA